MPELAKSPNLGALYAKAVLSTPVRRGSGELPATEYVRRDLNIDLGHLAQYDRICGFGVRDAVPITYPHVLAFPLSVRLMTDPGFPHRLVGLVHIANTIRQYRPLQVTEQPTVRVWLADERPHPKGRQFDVCAELDVAGEVVWREASTYLRRGAGSGERTAHAAAQPGEPIMDWHVPTGIGARYAAVSGDRNPIHLNRFAAKAFGFPRTIAHGMWTLARCMSAFEDRVPASSTITAEFGKPVLVPSRVDFAAASREQGWGREQGWDFGVYSRSGKPHVTGTVRP